MDLSPEAREILLISRALVDYGWTQGDMALNKKKGYTHATSSEAVCWCALGAIDRAVFFLDGEQHVEGSSGYMRVAQGKEQAIIALAHAMKERVYSNQDVEMLVVEFNDDPKTTQQKVVAAFDQALREG